MTTKENITKATELNDKSLKSLHEGKIEEAITLLAEAIKLDPTLDLAYGNLGICFAQLRKYEEAKTAFNKALEINPKKISYHTGIAAIYLDTRQYDNAEKHLVIAKKINPKNLAYLLNYGLWLFVTNKYQETITHHEELLSSGLLPETDLRNNAIVNYRLAFSYIEENNVGRGLDIIEECLNSPYIENDTQLSAVFFQLKGRAEYKIGG